MGKLAQKIADLAAAQEKQVATLAAITSKANGPGLGDALSRAGVEVVGDVVETSDRYKGKGLGFVRAARARQCQRDNGWTREETIKHFGFDRDDRRSKSMLKTFSVIDERGFDQVIRGTFQSVDKFSDAGTLRTKALGESTFGGGGAFVPDELSMEFLDLLRPMIAFMKCGVESIPMARETLSFARETVGSTPGWVGENAAAPYSDQQFDSPQLQLKKLAAITVLSNDLLRDASIAPDVIVRNDLLKQALLVLDLAFIRSLGSAYSPKGVRYIIPTANVVNSVVGGGTPTFQTALKDINNLKKILANANIPEIRRALIGAPRTFLGFDLLTDGVGGTPLGNEMSQKGTLRGVPFFQTTQIPTNLANGGSGGSAESELTMLEATEFIIGEGMQPTIDIERNAAYVDGSGNVQSGLSKDQTAIRLILRSDLIAKHQPAAAVGNGYTYGS